MSSTTIPRATRRECPVNTSRQAVSPTARHNVGVAMTRSDKITDEHLQRSARHESAGRQDLDCTGKDVSARVATFRLKLAHDQSFLGPSSISSALQTIKVCASWAHFLNRS
jgi:hypothetical protein